MKPVIALLALLVAVPASAEGFRTDDLRGVRPSAPLFSGTAQVGVNERARTSYLCADCATIEGLDVILGRSTDGTEGRYRSGATTIADMAALCRRNNPSCETAALSLGGAVGWVTTYETGIGGGSTAILFQDGDTLTLRALSGSPEAARATVQRGLETLATAIVAP